MLVLKRRHLLHSPHTEASHIQNGAIRSPMHSFMVFGFMVNKNSFMLSLLLTQTHFGAESARMAEHWKAHKRPKKGKKGVSCQKGISKCKHTSPLESADRAKRRTAKPTCFFLQCQVCEVLWNHLPEEKTPGATMWVQGEEKHVAQHVRSFGKRCAAVDF